MKKLGLILAGLFLSSTLVSTALAVPLTNDGYNGLFFNNFEKFVELGQDPTTIEVGDTFWGVLQAQNIVNAGADDSGQTGPNTWFAAGGLGPPNEITGYFAMEVAAIIPAAGGPTDPTNTIIYQPTADPNGILAAGEVLQIFESNTINFNSVDWATGLATATDGTPSWTLGLQPSDDSPGGYFYTISPLLIPDVGAIGDSYAGMNFLSLSDQLRFMAIDDPNEIFANLLTELWFNSEAFVLQNPNVAGFDPTLFDIGSNDPAVVFPTSAIPEPTSMLLLGTGLVGLAGARRRRKAAKK